MSANELQRLVADMARHPDLAGLLRRQPRLEAFAAVARSQGYDVTPADAAARIRHSLAGLPLPPDVPAMLPPARAAATLR